ERRMKTKNPFIGFALYLHDALNVLARPGWSHVEVSLARDDQDRPLFDHLAVVRKEDGPAPELGSGQEVMEQLELTMADLEEVAKREGVAWNGKTLAVRKTTEGELVLLLHPEEGEPVEAVKAPPDVVENVCVFTRPVIEAIGKSVYEVAGRQAGLDRLLPGDHCFKVDLNAGELSVGRSEPLSEHYRASPIAHFSKGFLTWAWAVENLTEEARAFCAGLRDSRPFGEATVLDRPRVMTWDSSAFMLAATAAGREAELGIYRAPINDAVWFLAVGAKKLL
ncbi:MAG: DUF6882 domain-containing protein, partial [Pseudomonadota bacterium]